MSNAIERSPQSFVGRTDELRHLQATLTSVLDCNRPQFVLIEGEFGAGKTALVEYFLSKISDENLLIGRANCAMETEKSGLTPYALLLKSLVKAAADRKLLPGSATEFLEQVAPAWLDVLAAESIIHDISAGAMKPRENDRISQNQTADAATTIGRSGGTNIEAETVSIGGDTVGRDKIIHVTNIYGQGSGRSYTQTQVLVQFTNAIHVLSEMRPVIAFIDDLQWADVSSLELLFYLAQDLERGSILFIGAYRTVDALEMIANEGLFRKIEAELIGHRGAIEIEIQEGLIVKDYIARRYPRNSFPKGLIDRVQEQTEGHALFIAELFTLWEEQGIVTERTSRGQPIWRLSSSATQLEIPRKLSEVLKQLLQLMDDELRGVLRVASVEGEDFAAQVVARVQQLEERRTYRDLAIIKKQYRLIRDLNQQEKEFQTVLSKVLDFYRFAHRFFRQHVYDKELEEGERVLLHREVGRCLEELYQSDIQVVAAQLARHFSEAHEFAQAAQYALLAARFEQTKYALAVSEQWCESGLKWLENAPAHEREQLLWLRVDLLETAGDVYRLRGNCGHADQHYRAALELALNLSMPPDRSIGLCEKLADVCECEGRYNEVLQFVQQGRKILINNDVPFGELHLKLDQDEIFIQMRLGQNEQAVRSFKQLLADIGNKQLPPSPTLDDLRAKTYNGLAITYSNLSRYSESIEAYKYAIELAERVGNRALVATCLLNMADNHFWLGDFEQCQVHLDRGAKIAEQIGDWDAMAYAQASRGAILLKQGHPRKAISEIEKAIDRFEHLESTWNMPYMYADLAMAYVALSDLDAAYAHARRALSYAEESGGQDETGWALDVLAQVEAGRGNRRTAQRYFKQAIDIDRKIGDRHAEGLAKRHLAEALLQQGRQDESRKLLQQALRLFRKLGFIGEAAKSEDLLQGLRTEDKSETTRS